MDSPRTVLVAIGGNALTGSGQPGTIPEQRDRARVIAAAIVQVIADGARVLVTHGNGPQVGAALLRSECAAALTYPLPLDVCDAATQGEIGYLLQQVLQAELARAGIAVPVATVVTQVVVSDADPAMTRSTKPVGAGGGGGRRRLVPSPEPLVVVEEAVIRQLFESGVVVVAAGGGGIPVVRRGPDLIGVEAVVDKDSTSALLASRLKIDQLVIAMDADRIYLHYGTPGQQPLDRVTTAELEGWEREGRFPAGSMGPKVRAALRFLRDGGREVVVCSFDQLPAAVQGRGGTHIIPGPTDRPSSYS